MPYNIDKGIIADSIRIRHTVRNIRYSSLGGVRSKQAEQIAKE